MSDAYQALAHPIRRQIIAMIREGAMTAGEIAAEVDVSKPTLSGHFNILKAAGLISVERRGAKLFYRANLSVLEEAVANLMALFRLGSETIVANKPVSGPDRRHLNEEG